MAQIPPFPSGLRIAPVPRISLLKLEQGDELEEARLFKACIEFGCLLLDLTGTADAPAFLSDIDRAASIGKSFFDAPSEEKLKFPINKRSVGYKAPHTFKLPGEAKDEVELYGVGKDRISDPSNRDTAPQFLEHRTFISSFIAERLHPVGMLILKLIATHLEVPASTLLDLHSNAVPSGSTLRFLHYPGTAIDSHAVEGTARLMGHTDNGSLSVLFTALGGLQLLPASAHEHDSLAWEWVKPEPGCAFINVGDSLVQWTGGILRSIYHRVVPAPGSQASHDRYSFGYFLKPIDTASMRRLHGGLIPDLGREEEPDICYEDWHLKKNESVYSGVNGMSRGGTTPIAWKKRNLVEASS